MRGRVYFPSAAGANFIGSPLVSAADSVYVLYEDQCLRLDAATGEPLATFDLPSREDLLQHAGASADDKPSASYGTLIQEGPVRRWGNLRSVGDHLVVAAYPHMFDDAQPGHRGNWNATSSEFLVVLDRYTGDVRWVHQARYGFRHNAIAAGSDRVFAIDNLSQEILDRLDRRGIEPDTAPRIRAFDLESGEARWAFADDVFGTALAYSEPYDILVQSGHLRQRAPLPDEPRDRVLVLDGSDGERLWSADSRLRRAPLGLHAERGQIIASSGEGAFDMRTGQRVERAHPMTGVPESWAWTAALRCGTQNFSTHLITFRSGAAGFTDLKGGAMTGNISGFRSGCTSNLIVADGLLNIPEYTRSCSCNYPLQTSLGMVHAPAVEMWLYGHFSEPGPDRILRAGLNFAAPGSRFDLDRDLLWVEYPPNVEPNPRFPVTVEAVDEWDVVRHHSSWIKNPDAGPAWVASYGIVGANRIQLDLTPEAADSDPALYDVTLYFAELEPGVQAGDRVFAIDVQGETVRTKFDPAAAAGGPRHLVKVHVEQVPVSDQLVVSFEPQAGSLPATLSGVAVWIREPAP